MSSKLREALKEIHCRISNHLSGNLSETKMLLDIKNIINAALSDPPRQCDVGSAEEKSARFDKFCYAHRSYEKGCENCPLLPEPSCELGWAQMPYEEVK